MDTNDDSASHPSFPITRPDFKKYVTHEEKSLSSRWRILPLSRYFSVMPSVYAATEDAENQPASEAIIRQTNDIPVLVTDDEVQAVLSKETGRDRLTQMWSKTDAPSTMHQNISPQMKFVKYIAESSTAVGFVFGFSRGSRLGAEERMTKHLTARYPHKVTRLRRYYDAILIKGVKMGLIYGLTCGAFSGLFMLISQSISVYRNKSSFVEFACAGGVTAALSRIHIGPRAIISGGVLGTSLGTIGGSLIYALLKFTKETQEQKHYWDVYQRLRHRKQVEIMSKS